ncbi:hypothetical protein KC573_00680 [candidate division WWE3 bacterium]|uniref:Uncharacterized protein n=1 Tax=candidate division WWE3 bacterium TaxID=2053526 RepID=A0A955RWR4_UNCKA|nr:hypothetical protein [candidate division WWE3 bacterium]
MHQMYNYRIMTHDGQVGSDTKDYNLAYAFLKNRNRFAWIEFERKGKWSYGDAMEVAHQWITLRYPQVKAVLMTSILVLEVPHGLVEPMRDDLIAIRQLGGAEIEIRPTTLGPEYVIIWDPNKSRF